jgi:hypothetical protein
MINEVDIFSNHQISTGRIQSFLKWRNILSNARIFTALNLIKFHEALVQSFLSFKLSSFPILLAFFNFLSFLLEELQLKNEEKCPVHFI